MANENSFQLFGKIEKLELAKQDKLHNEAEEDKVRRAIGIVIKRHLEVFKELERLDIEEEKWK